MSNAAALPLVDVEPLVTRSDGREHAAAAIDRACREVGFFYATGHGVDAALQERLEELSRRFFARPVDEKHAIRMELGGRAWRGWFPVGGELTSGRPDHKEGIYFGAELGEDDPRVAAGTPLFGPNLFPEIEGFRATVLGYMDALTHLGHALMEGLALGLGLEAGHFAEHLTGDPTILFRIFHYPPLPQGTSDWGVAEHTDYGLLTILRQDASGGLEVHARDGWRPAPPVEDAFVCNIGDMLERITGGRYRSTAHRVRNPGRTGRLSFPFFFDPGFDAPVRPIDPGHVAPGDPAERWDGASVHDFRGTYGEYLLAKVARVFPELGEGVLPPGGPT